jgi:hypothetical protein
VAPPRELVDAAPEPIDPPPRPGPRDYTQHPPRRTPCQDYEVVFSALSGGVGGSAWPSWAKVLARRCPVGADVAGKSFIGEDTVGHVPVVQVPVAREGLKLKGSRLATDGERLVKGTVELFFGAFWARARISEGGQDIRKPRRAASTAQSSPMGTMI